MTSRLSRMQRDALARQDAQILPLPLLKTDADSLAAHMRHMVGLLRDRRTESPCASAAAYIAALFDRTMPHATKLEVACRQGCTHCCNQSVAVYAPEAFAIAAQLRMRPETRDAVAQIEQRMRGRPVEQKNEGWVRCPMLEDNNCSIYATRPLGCRGFVSMALNDCIATFVLMGEPSIKSPDAYGLVQRRCRAIFIGALRLSGLSDVAYELNSALTAIFAHEDAEKRWLEGEDIFAGVTVCVPSRPEKDIAQLVAYVAPTI